MMYSSRPPFSAAGQTGQGAFFFLLADQRATHYAITVQLFFLLDLTLLLFIYLLFFSKSP